jgi:hypothetical protein
MVEREDGYWWWAIGRLRHPVEGLPKWEAKYREPNVLAEAISDAKAVRATTLANAEFKLTQEKTT